MTSTCRRKLQQQVPLLDSHREVAMVYAATEYLVQLERPAEDARRDWTWRNYGAPPNTVIDPPRMLIAFLQDGGTVPCMGSVLVRRAALERVGGWEDSFRYICTDQVFHAKLCLRFPVLIADACWDRYRQHEDSACRTVAREGQSDAAFQRYLTLARDVPVAGGERRSGGLDGAAKGAAALSTPVAPSRRAAGLALRSSPERHGRTDDTTHAPALAAAPRARPVELTG